MICLRRNGMETSREGPRIGKNVWLPGTDRTVEHRKKVELQNVVLMPIDMSLKVVKFIISSVAVRFKLS